MNESMLEAKTWHPMGIRVGALQISPAVHTELTIETWANWAALFAKLLTIDQSESCGFCRNARVINL